MISGLHAVPAHGDGICSAVYRLAFLNVDCSEAFRAQVYTLTSRCRLFGQAQRNCFSKFLRLNLTGSLFLNALLLFID